MQEIGVPGLNLAYAKEYATIASTMYTTFVFTGGKILLSNSSNITSARVGLFGDALEIDETSAVLTSGLGCPAGQGMGMGFKDDEIAKFCPGSGASHGGFGGPGVAKSIYSRYQFICNSMVNINYGDNKNPIFEGSGGGISSYSLNGGSGGGVVIIAARTVQIDGQVTADGRPGGTERTINGGAGSGGSIQIHSVVKLTGSGAISAKGGDSLNNNGFGKRERF